jgi:two-component system, NarL family, response regulator NreC
VKRIRVALADDHAVVREGLRALFASHADIEVVGEAGTGPAAVECAAETTPQVLCLDLSMPGSGVAATIQRVKSVSSQTRVLVLSMHDDPAYVRSALTAGADGYMLKTTASPVLLAAIRSVAKGEQTIDPALSDVLRGDRPVHTGGPAVLSRREHEVISLLARGHTHHEIAERLFVSVKSIETYRARIREKTGLKTRADFVRYGVEAGLLGTTDPTGPAE